MKTSVKILALLSLVGLLIFVAQTTVAQENAQDKQPATRDDTPKDVKDITYLGLTVEPVHRSLWSHLHGVFRHKEGLLVLHVDKGSPAERAGIRTDDILVTYDRQYLFSADQLAKLVTTDKVDRVVDIGVVRYGAPQDMKVTLGVRKASMDMPALYAEQETLQSPHWIAMRKNAKEDEAAWDEFDCLILKSLGNHRFEAQIQYKDKDGKIDRHSYTGTREEIHKQILTEEDLPAIERDNLLRSLDLPNNALELSGIVYGLGVPYWFSNLWPGSF